MDEQQQPPNPTTTPPQPAAPQPAAPRPAAPPRYDLRRESLEAICTWTAVRAGGPGGQHRNKAFTGVRLTHPPSGLTITATERRSQAQNLDNAYERLVERLQALMERRKPRKPTRMPEAIKRQRLDDKKRRADVKKARSRVDE
jgi:protein subunit release factor B